MAVPCFFGFAMKLITSTTNDYPSHVRRNFQSYLTVAQFSEQARACGVHIRHSFENALLCFPSGKNPFCIRFAASLKKDSISSSSQFLHRLQLN